MNFSFTWTWNSYSHSIHPKRFFFHSTNWRFCSFLVWIHSTWCHFNDFPLNGESSIITFQWQARWSISMHHKLYPNSNCDANTIQAINIWWGGTTLKNCNPVLCQCQIQLFATIDSQTIIAKQKCNDQIWMTGEKSLQQKTVQQLTWTWCEINWPALMLQ